MNALGVGVGVSGNPSTQEAVAEAVRLALSGLKDAKPQLAVVTSTVDHDVPQLHRLLRDSLGDEVAIHGVTTSLGVLSNEGITGSFGLMLFAGSDLEFRAGSAQLDGDSEAAGRKAATALGDGVPRIVLYGSSPGDEESILAGVTSVLGAVPIFGGSAADHAIAGEWQVFTNDGTSTNAVSLAAIYGDFLVGTHFLTPYVPTGKSVRVTRAEGRRLVELDAQPAAEALVEWVGESVRPQATSGGNVLAQTALRPFGIKKANGFHLTVHPARVDADGAVDVFASIPEGTEICAMESTAEELVDSLGALIAQAKVDGGFPSSDGAVSNVAGGVLIYCAGCAGAVGEALHEAVRVKWAEAFGDSPLLGMCTFGEQGTLADVGAVHANLSMSLVLFGESPGGS